MHDMFKYDYVRNYLIGESYFWEDNFSLIERVINVTDIIIVYPKILYSENSKEEKYILFFCKNSIYVLSYENGKDFTLVTYYPRNISTITMSCKGRENATLCLKISEKEILLASSDAKHQIQYSKFTDALLHIAKLYS